VEEEVKANKESRFCSFWDFMVGGSYCFSKMASALCDGDWSILSSKSLSVNSQWSLFYLLDHSLWNKWKN